MQKHTEDTKQNLGLHNCEVIQVQDRIETTKLVNTRDYKNTVTTMFSLPTNGFIT